MIYTDTFTFAPPGTLHGEHGDHGDHGDHGSDMLDMASKPMFMVADAYVSAAFFVLLTAVLCLSLFACVGKPVGVAHDHDKHDEEQYSYPAFGGLNAHPHDTDGHEPKNGGKHAYAALGLQAAGQLC